jgi:hypothetical protein
MTFRLELNTLANLKMACFMEKVEKSSIFFR